MSKENDKLLPDNSPEVQNCSGVKKVNNLPLLIVLSILTLFIIIVAMVAAKKGAEQNRAVSAPLSVRNSKQVDTMQMAKEVIASNEHVNRGKNVLLPTEPLPELVKPETATSNEAPSLPSPPTATQETPVVSEISETELERLRQDKAKDFEEAVKEKITVSVNKSLTSTSTTSAPLGYKSYTGDPSGTFKEQLKLLQDVAGKIQGQQTASSIGGQESDGRWFLKSKLQSPTTAFELRAGAVIPGVLISGIRSELHGQIIGQVSQDVYDTATGNHLLVPQGTKLLGVYSNDVSFGQDSILVAWQRLVFPDGKALDIGGMSGSDSAGYAGFRDEVDHHYARIYGSAILMSGIIAGVSYSQNRNPLRQNNQGGMSAGDVLSQSLGQQLGETATQLISKNLNTAPTINIRPGYEFNVTVTKDLVFDSAYQQFSY